MTMHTARMAHDARVATAAAANAYLSCLSRAGGQQIAAAASARHDEVFASFVRCGPYDLEFPAVPSPRLSIVLTPSQVSGALDGERWRQLHVRPRALFLTPAHRRARWHKPAASRHINLYFGASMMQDVADAMGLQASLWQQPLINLRSPQLAAVIDLLVAEMRAPDDGDSMAIDALTRLLLIRMLRELRTPPGEPEVLTPRQLRALNEYVDAHLSERIMVADIAHALGMSAARLTRAMARQLQASPHRYVMRRRLDAAVRLLTATRCSLSEIAAGTGYASQQHMTNAFTRYLGTTPNALRNERSGRAHAARFERRPARDSTGTTDC